MAAAPNMEMKVQNLWRLALILPITGFSLSLILHHEQAIQEFGYLSFPKLTTLDQKPGPSKSALLPQALSTSYSHGNCGK